MKMAFHKLGPALQSDIRFREQIASHCGTLNSEAPSPVEKFVMEHLPIPNRTGPGTACTLLAKHAHATRYHIRSYWDFKIQIRNQDGVPIADRHFNLEFPRPLVLLPLALFLLALVFEFPQWGLKATALSYVFLLCGANIINLFRAAGQATFSAFTGESPWIGLFLVLVWVALAQARRVPRIGTPKTTIREKWLNRFFLGTVGLWNPAAFTLCGRLILPFEGAVQRGTSFFTAQTAALALSLYLLAMDLHELRGFFSDSILTPRYFTFGLLLFLLLSYQRPKREPIAWQMPGFWRAVFFVAGVEAAVFQTSFLAGTSTLGRIGVALVASQLVWPISIHWSRALKNTVRWGLPLVFAAMVTEMSTQQSANDLALLIFDPDFIPPRSFFSRLPRA